MPKTLKTARLWTLVVTVVVLAGAVSALSGTPEAAIPMLASGVL